MALRRVSEVLVTYNDAHCIWVFALAWMLRLMTSHLQQESIRRFLRHIIKFSGEKRAYYHAGSKMELREQGKKTSLGFMVAKSWSWRVGCHWFQGRQYSDFLLSVPRCGAERIRGVVKFQSYQQSNIKIESVFKVIFLGSFYFFFQSHYTNNSLSYSFPMV